MACFIVSIDGPDFCGKTTIANLLVELLRQKNSEKDITFKRTALPSELITGSFTKILRNSADKVVQEEFALCYALDHLHHYNNVISQLENTENKYVIILERSLLSTYIYQALIGGVDLEWLREINKYCKTKPNITFILKVDIEELMKRAELEKRGFDKFEAKEWLEKEIKVYYNLPEVLKKEFNVELIDANDEPLEVAEKLAEKIQKEIEKFF
jgi:dTMP kinase